MASEEERATVNDKPDSDKEAEEAEEYVVEKIVDVRVRRGVVRNFLRIFPDRFPNKYLIDFLKKPSQANVTGDVLVSPRNQKMLKSFKKSIYLM